MSGTQLYLIVLRLSKGSEPGTDVPMFITKVSTLLGDYAKATKCLYKFKVTGEARIVAVFEVCNIIGFERTIAGLHRMGVFDVSCHPLMSYESFAQMLGCDDSLTLPSTYSLTDTQLYWLEFNVEYPGKSMAELLGTWKREAEAALSARVLNGMHIDLFKVIAERKVHVFVMCSAEELDKLTFTLPVMAENGNGVTITCRALQRLEDYTSRIMNEEL